MTQRQYTIHNPLRLAPTHPVSQYRGEKVSLSQCPQLHFTISHQQTDTLGLVIATLVYLLFSRRKLRTHLKYNANSIYTYTVLLPPGQCRGCHLLTLQQWPVTRLHLCIIIQWWGSTPAPAPLPPIITQSTVSTEDCWQVDCVWLVSPSWPWTVSQVVSWTGAGV